MAHLLKTMSTDLLTPESTLVYLMRSAPYRYKVFEIDKHQTDEKRTIAQPARELKTLQYWVMENVLSSYPVHPAAMAYRKNRGILDNAKAHASRSFLLKLDFKDFFHSIRAEDFRQFLNAKSPERFTSDEASLLTRALFWNRERKGKLILSIGAPSSPLLSNLILYDFDTAVQTYCAAKKIRYTRYADDLTFSTNTPRVLRTLEQQIAKICRQLKSPTLRLNKAKTVHASRGGSRRVTGLVLSNDGNVSIGHEKKRVLRATVNRYVHRKLNEEEIASLRGMLAYVRSVEPGFIQVLASYYGKSKIRKLLE
jgi:RNA-directed DNA polymerase